MSYSTQEAKDLRIVVIEANFEGGWATLQLKDEISTLLEGGERKFLIDMGDSRYVNSTGIGVLATLQSCVKKVDGVVKFCGVNDVVRRSLFASGPGMWHNMEVYPDSKEALRSFGLY